MASLYSILIIVYIYMADSSLVTPFTLRSFSGRKQVLFSLLGRFYELTSCLSVEKFGQASGQFVCVPVVL